MPDKDKRVDLGAELDEASKALAADVQSAADEVRKRQEADRAKEARYEERAQSRKLTAVIVAVAAVVILLLSYWIVFGGPGGGPDEAATNSQGTRATAPASSSPANTCVTPRAPQGPPKAYAPTGGSPQPVEDQPDGYQQPGEGMPGM